MEDSDDDQLNVQSEKFNPLNALYSNKLVLPCPTAPVLDNVAKANYLLSNNLNLDHKPVVRKKVPKEEEPSTSICAKRDSDLSEGTRFRKKHKEKNLLKQIEETKGPLGFLRNCMEKRLRVKVWTRSARGIRGYSVGFVAAFDKHWNLALEDVQEVWTRPVKRKKFLLGEPNEMPLAWKAMGPAVKPPKIIVSKKANGMETCERHVNQMLMRGEHIALISVSDT